MKNMDTKNTVINRIILFKCNVFGLKQQNVGIFQRCLFCASLRVCSVCFQEKKKNRSASDTGKRFRHENKLKATFFCQNLIKRTHWKWWSSAWPRKYQPNFWAYFLAFLYVIHLPIIMFSFFKIDKNQNTLQIRVSVKRYTDKKIHFLK